MTRVSGQQRWLGAKVSEAIYCVDESASGHTGIKDCWRGSTRDGSGLGYGRVTLCSS
jgi:hypothetical protein